MIRWFANNGIAANLLMFAILAAGFNAAWNKVPLEVVPESSAWEIVYMEMPYRGGTPKDIEENVLIPVERALEGISGIREVNSDGMPGMAKFYFKAKEGVDLDKLLDEIKSRIDTISTFPGETERAKIIIPDSSGRLPVLSVAVTGEFDEAALLQVTKKVQREILELEGVSRADIQGVRKTEISIEADLAKLRAYKLTFRELADAIRSSSINLTAGTIRSDSGRLVVKTRGQAYQAAEFEKILIRAANGADVMLGEVAKVNDGFEEDQKIVEFNGRPAMFIQVRRARGEDAIEISDRIKKYVSTRAPEGAHLYAWNDSSLSIRGRLGTLISSLLQGCVLVFLILGLFLRPQVALWVVLGIPISFAGGVLVMSMDLPFFEIYPITANVMSLFGFIIVLGVVVDDAIVTGENIFAKLQTGMDPLEASVLGTKEVAVPVTFGILTTIAAFVPLSHVSGGWGDFAKQIPPVVIPVLLFSLVESKLILPSHLKHVRPRGKNIGIFGRFQKGVADGMERFVDHVYIPILKVAVRYRFSVLALFIALAMAMAGYWASGRMGFASFPAVENLRISADLNLPNDFPIERTHAYVERITAATEILKKEYTDPKTGETLIRNVARITGSSDFEDRPDSSRGKIVVEVMPPSERSEAGPTNAQIAKRWAELVGEIEEADSFYIHAEITGKERREQQKENSGSGEPMALELRGPNSEAKNQIAEKIKKLMRGYDGIGGAWAQINRGQDEIEFTLKPRAAELGITQGLLAQQVRQAFYGEEAQRIIRDGEEIRIMLRLPKDDRKSLHTLSRLKIRSPRGAEVSLNTVANYRFTKAPTFVERNDGAEVIRIGGMPQDDSVDIVGIAEELDPEIRKLTDKVKGLSFLWTGYVAEHEESVKKIWLNAAFLLFALYALLAIPFRSVVQPIYVLLAVPFGVIGALLGHLIMDITPNFLSVFGMLALAGVVVNDSLVMVDFVNRRRRVGMPLIEAALAAGARRFRPIILTSLTTFAGLVPLL
ncbi:MAG: efflux RND transporter permease subunit, partial [Akkermansiaceae bacterium]|nr:efflux RND transporter permease subunit [Akkermansiaceae bacterium]